MFVLADSAGNTPPRRVTRTPQNAQAQVSFKEVLNQNREKLERLSYAGPIGFVTREKYLKWKDASTKGWFDWIFK